MRRAGALLAGLVALAACTSSSPSRSSESGPSSSSAGGARHAIEVTPLEGRPSALVVHGDTVWVADDDRGLVLRLDATDGRQLGPPIAVTPHPIAIDADATNVWVGDRDGDLTRVDIATGAASAPIALGGQLTDLVSDGTTVWVADIEAGTITPVRVADGAVAAPIQVPEGVVRIALTGDGLAITNLEKSVTTIDRATGALSAPTEVGNGPIGIAAADDGTVWVANSDDGTLQRVGGPTIKVGSSPTAVAIAGDEVYVIDHDSRDIARVSRVTGQLVAQVALGSTPRDLSIGATGVWVAAIDPSAAILVTAAPAAAAASS